ncbi:hypothetical protein [Agarivorans sp. DSG3-1]|uniref:hypothetical protein n=1 Tax=Agarivorans sp. DSG3-1 TaxID=3342249 RepID=UPI00398F6AF1
MFNDLTDATKRMLSDFANGLHIEFCLNQKGEEFYMTVRGKLSKGFDRRTLNNLIANGLVRYKVTSYLGTPWRIYGISTKGWEVFNART